MVVVVVIVVVVVEIVVVVVVVSSSSSTSSSWIVVVVVVVVDRRRRRVSSSSVVVVEPALALGLNSPRTVNVARKLPLPALPARSRACPQRPSSGGLGDTRNRTRGAVTRRWRAIKLIFTRQVSSKSERSNDDSTPSDSCGCTLRDYWPGPESGH